MATYTYTGYRSCEEDQDCDEYVDITAELLYKARLAAHPDCRDPEHPGCERCWESDQEPDPYDENILE